MTCVKLDILVHNNSGSHSFNISIQLMKYGCHMSILEFDINILTGAVLIKWTVYSPNRNEAAGADTYTDD